MGPWSHKESAAWVDFKTGTRWIAGALIAGFTGDKVVRPILVGSSTQLGFVWVLMGTLGALELLEFIGIFVGPVVLSLAGELWRERTWKIERDHTPQASIDTPHTASHPLANSAAGHAGRT